MKRRQTHIAVRKAKSTSRTLYPPLYSNAPESNMYDEKTFATSRGVVVSHGVGHDGGDSDGEGGDKKYRLLEGHGEPLPLLCSGGRSRVDSRGNRRVVCRRVYNRRRGLLQRRFSIIILLLYLPVLAPRKSPLPFRRNSDRPIHAGSLWRCGCDRDDRRLSAHRPVCRRAGRRQSRRR